MNALYSEKQDKKRQINQSVNQSISRSIDQSVSRYVNQSFCLSVSQQSTLPVYSKSEDHQEERHISQCPFCWDELYQGFPLQCEQIETEFIENISRQSDLGLMISNFTGSMTFL